MSYNIREGYSVKNRNLKDALPYQASARSADYADFFSEKDMGFCIYKTHLDEEISLHFHDFYEFEIILGGEVTHNFNGNIHKLTKGNVVFLTQSDFHGFYNLTKPIRGYTIHFTEHHIEPELMRIFQGYRGAVTELSSEILFAMASECEQLLYEYNNNAPMRSFAMRQMLQKIILFYIRSVPAVKEEKYSETGMQFAVIYINKNFRQKLTRDEVAGVVHLNSDYFSVKFHEYAGVSFQEYLNKKRVQWAYDILQSTDISISEICNKSGFGSVSQFNRSFKKEYGKTPSEIRIEAKA